MCAGKTAILLVSASALQDVRATAQLHHAEQNRAWLQDLCVRLVCVFALDRFSDFEGNTVVVPVRETCAQALGVTCKYLQDPSVVAATCKQGLLGIMSVSKNNSTMDPAAIWGLRYGGLLGIKYVFALRKDLVGELLKDEQVIGAILAGYVMWLSSECRSFHHYHCSFSPLMLFLFSSDSSYYPCHSGHLCELFSFPHSSWSLTRLILLTPTRPASRIIHHCH